MAQITHRTFLSKTFPSIFPSIFSNKPSRVLSHMVSILSSNLTLSLVLGLSLTTQLNAQTSDPFQATFVGTWKNTQINCRTVENGTVTGLRVSSLIPSNSVFMPDVEISFNQESIRQKDGTFVPSKNVEKAVTHGSCLLPKPEISAANSQQGTSANTAYVWSKNRIQLVKAQTLNGVQYYTLSGQLVDKRIDYKAIRNCGNNIQTALGAWQGIIPALLTYYRYDFGKSYSEVEANRNYTISVVKNTLNLEFFDTEICSQPNERVVMVFTKK